MSEFTTVEVVQRQIEEMELDLSQHAIALAKVQDPVLWHLAKELLLQIQQLQDFNKAQLLLLEGEQDNRPQSWAAGR